MNVRIAPDVFTKFHEQFAVGVIFCSGIHVGKKSGDVYEMLRDVEELIRVGYTPADVHSHLTFSAWKAAVAHFGEKAAHYESNVEKLMTEVLGGHEIPSVNMLADLCNFVSLKHVIPLGVVDAGTLGKKIEFGLARGDEQFSAGKSSVEKGELILRDNNGIIFRKLEYAQDERSLVSTSTKQALILVESLPPFTEDKLQYVLEELSGLVRVFCGGKCKRVILDKKKTSVEF